MAQEELIKFLKENLKIETHAGAYHIEVSLYLGNEKISSSVDFLDFIRK